MAIQFLNEPKPQEGAYKLSCRLTSGIFSTHNTRFHDESSLTIVIDSVCLVFWSGTRLWKDISWMELVRHKISSIPYNCVMANGLFCPFRLTAYHRLARFGPLVCHFTSTRGPLLYWIEWMRMIDEKKSSLLHIRLSFSIVAPWIYHLFWGISYFWASNAVATTCYHWRLWCSFSGIAKKSRKWR